MVIARLRALKHVLAKFVSVTKLAGSKAFRSSTSSSYWIVRLHKKLEPTLTDTVVVVQVKNFLLAALTVHTAVIVGEPSLHLIAAMPIPCDFGLSYISGTSIVPTVGELLIKEVIELNGPRIAMGEHTPGATEAEARLEFAKFKAICNNNTFIASSVNFSMCYEDIVKGTAAWWSSHRTTVPSSHEPHAPCFQSVQLP